MRRGGRTNGVLPGGLKVRRRAAELHAQLADKRDDTDPLRAMEWVTLYALAVNEENAAGGRVVTAPTNGAAGIVPAVLHYYRDFIGSGPTTAWSVPADRRRDRSAVQRTPPSRAPRSAARARWAGLLDGGRRPGRGARRHAGQVENAAEIGMEHNLGLTCDPVGGLVQIPCIERNAIGIVKAITAARMAMRGDGTHHVTLDKVIKTMRETGADMKIKYKETARGGLAVNVVEC